MFPSTLKFYTTCDGVAHKILIKQIKMSCCNIMRLCKSQMDMSTSAGTIFDGNVFHVNLHLYCEVI